MTPEPLSVLAPGRRRLQEKHLAACPVRIGEQSAELGVAVRVSGLAGSASGVLLRDGASGGCIIGVERREARNRQRFTIARGLAHVLLHRGIIDRRPGGIRLNAGLEEPPGVNTRQQNAKLRRLSKSTMLGWHETTIQFGCPPNHHARAANRTQLFSRQYWQEDDFPPEVRRRVKWAAVLAMVSVAMLAVQIVYVYLL